MKFEGVPQQPSPEEMAKTEKERALSDAELLKGGAEYKFDDEGNKTLEVTGEQVDGVKEEMERDLNIEEPLGKTKNQDEEQKIEQEISANSYESKMSETEIQEERMNMFPDESKLFYAMKDYEKEIQKLNLLVNEGKMSEEEYGKELKKQLKETTDVTSLLEKEIKDSKRWEEIVRMSQRETQLQISDNILRETNSFDDLHKNINKFRFISCSDREVNLPKKYISIIENVRNGKQDFESIPQLNGIEADMQAKVKQLMERDGLEHRPDLPPDTTWFKDEDIKELDIDFGRHPYSRVDVPDKLSDMFGVYPAIGASGLRTEYGQVNGKLIWCDGQIAIFQTPEGKIKMPFRKLKAPSGKTYEEIEKDYLYEQDQERRRRTNSRSRER